jgi:hypothetical protein
VKRDGAQRQIKKVYMETEGLKEKKCRKIGEILREGD